VLCTPYLAVYGLDTPSGMHKTNPRGGSKSTYANVDFIALCQVTSVCKTVRLHFGVQGVPECAVYDLTSKSSDVYLL
jgi:hypothetical protein